MCAAFRKKSALDARLKRIAREITALDTTIQTLERSAERGAQLAPPPEPEGPRPSRRERARATPPVAQEPASRAASGRAAAAAKDERFVSYLMAHGLDTTRPFRHERRVQRNKAVIVSLCALAALVWLVFKLVA